MDPKRPDVRLDEKPDEEGVVTKRDAGDERRRPNGLLARLRRFLGR